MASWGHAVDRPPYVGTLKVRRTATISRRLTLVPNATPSGMAPKSRVKSSTVYGRVGRLNPRRKVSHARRSYGRLVDCATVLATLRRSDVRLWRRYPYAPPSNDTAIASVRTLVG